MGFGHDGTDQNIKRSIYWLLRPVITFVPQESIKQPSESVWSAKQVVTTEWENQGSSQRNRYIKMEITRGKVGTVSFLYNLEELDLFF